MHSAVIALARALCADMSVPTTETLPSGSTDIPMHSPADHTDTRTAHNAERRSSQQSDTDTASWEHMDIGEDSQRSHDTLVGDVEPPAATSTAAIAMNPHRPYRASGAPSPPGPPDLREFHAWVPSPMTRHSPAQPAQTEPALEVSGSFVPDVGAGACIPMKVWLTFRELRQFGLAPHTVYILQGQQQQDSEASSSRDEGADCVQFGGESESEYDDNSDGEDGLLSMDSSATESQTEAMNMNV